MRISPSSFTVTNLRATQHEQACGSRFFRGNPKFACRGMPILVEDPDRARGRENPKNSSDYSLAICDKFLSFWQFFWWGACIATHGRPAFFGMSRAICSGHLPGPPREGRSQCIFAFSSRRCCSFRAAGCHESHARTRAHASRHLEHLPQRTQTPMAGRPGTRAYQDHQRRTYPPPPVLLA